MQRELTYVGGRLSGPNMARGMVPRNLLWSGVLAAAIAFFIAGAESARDCPRELPSVCQRREVRFSLDRSSGVVSGCGWDCPRYRWWMELVYFCLAAGEYGEVESLGSQVNPLVRGFFARGCLGPCVAGDSGRVQFDLGGSWGGRVCQWWRGIRAGFSLTSGDRGEVGSVSGGSHWV